MKNGSVISLFGTKGGIGKTVIAANLAIDIARETGSPVAIVDLDLSLNGDIELLLGMHQVKTIADMVPLLDGLEGELLRGYVSRHQSGIYVISALSDQKYTNRLTPTNIRKFLFACSMTFDYTIVDPGANVTQTALTVLDCSQLILLLTQADFLSLHQAVKALSFLRLHHFPRDRIEVVLNNVHPRIKKDDRTITTTLRRGVLEVLPSAPDVVGPSVLKREPFVLTAPRNILSRRIGELSLHCIRLASKLPPVNFKVSLDSKEAESASLAAKGIDPRSDEQTRSVLLSEREQMINAIKQKVHESLIDRLDLRRLDTETGSDPEKQKILKDETFKVIVELIDELGGALPSREERKRIAKEILDEALGLGPLEDLLADESVTEIMVNKYNRIYVERSGKIELTNYSFINNRQLQGVIERIVSPLGRRIDESTPFVDARLPDGSRVNAIIPPVSLQGPMITIRKFSKVPYNADDIIRFGSMTEEMKEFFVAAVCSRQNLLISGGTGSGKTTLLNVMSGFIPHDERIITIEDAAELKLTQDHVASLEARPPNIEGEGEVTIRDLVRNALRMRPDRIIVGECRGGETLDMLQAMNTGHDGSLTTIHANSPRDSLSRLETMVLFAGFEIPSIAIRQQVASALNIIIQTSRFSIDGTRKVTSVYEVRGMRSNDIILEPVFLFIQTGVSPEGKVQGKFLPTGHVPAFVEEYKRRGYHLDHRIFKISSLEDKKMLDEYLSLQKIVA